MVLGLALLASGLAAGLPTWMGAEATVRTPGAAGRLVSLTPSVTETLVALDAAHLLVGRSDFCHSTAPVEDIPVVGTAVQPNLEALVRLKPDHVLAANTMSLPSRALRQIAPITAYPWSTASEMASSVRALGTLVGKPDPAEALATRLERELGAAPPADGPRVLLALDTGAAVDGQLWFIKRNSLHGQALHAAGARNAVDEDIDGAPAMPIEALLKLDPDLLIIIAPQDDLEPSDLAARIAPLEGITALRAARDHRVGVLSGARLFSEGPALLDLVTALRSEIQRLQAVTP